MIAQRCSFQPGHRIDSQYTVKKVLGEGSFGIVYAVADDSGATYALKLLKLWEVPSEIRSSLMARFEMEFETGRIPSHYLVSSLRHGMVEGNPYILMEFCPGGDVTSLMEKQTLDVSMMAIHVLHGLKALHSCGKVHRDLKPENVLIKQDGTFALTDFGISGDRNKRMTELNILGKPKQIFGTYAYMPPEQLKPKKDATVLPTTDIFSFGVMIYQALTMELPFGPLEGEGQLVSYLRNGRNGAWDRNLLRQVPNGVKWTAMLEGTLQPDFHQRLQNVDAVLELVPPPAVPMHKVMPKEPERPAFETRVRNGVLLRVMQGEEYGKVYRLDDMLRGDNAILRMGRRDPSVNNELAITENNSSYISRRHCTLELDYDIGQWVIRDGQWDREASGGWRRSTNGTYVNSHEVSIYGMPFNPGDIISIGDTKLRAEAY
ncbi:MAG: FHA domain-containing serine/threonine-protein kinase [Bacteroidales bacterium]|nr:FHA domain-containing serine/threonine-protein kinase [Bacteroidales bacterium]